MIPSPSSDVGVVGVLLGFSASLVKGVSLFGVVSKSKSINIFSSARSSRAVCTPALRQLGGIDLSWFFGGFVDLLSVATVGVVEFCE